MVTINNKKLFGVPQYVPKHGSFLCNTRIISMATGIGVMLAVDVNLLAVACDGI